LVNWWACLVHREESAGLWIFGLLASRWEQGQFRKAKDSAVGQEQDGRSQPEETLQEPLIPLIHRVEEVPEQFAKEKGSFPAIFQAARDILLRR
jgi:hypothetical protein